MKRLALTAILGFVAILAYAGDNQGTASAIRGETYTISGSGSLTITNSNPTGYAEWWSAIEVVHTNDIPTATFTVTRTRDDGFPFTLWTTSAYTNSVAIELQPRAIKDGDVITFTVGNPVAGEETKVYVTKQSN